jgi:putative solute:sodium symporter small subunit
VGVRDVHRRPELPFVIVGRSRSHERSTQGISGAARTHAARNAWTKEEGAMSDSKEDAHWRKTTRLMLTHLGVWFFFGFIIHMFVHALNKVTIPILGFPLGFYMAAQGSLIVFVVQLFLFAKQQDKIDREFGFAEDDA